MRATFEIPHDAALPALAAIRARGLDRTLPALGIGGRPVVLLLRGYTAGDRATLEARWGGCRVAIKACAKDPTPEARLYEMLAERHLAAASPVFPEDGSVRVPRLLTWNRERRVLAAEWLDGASVNELIKQGQGERAGELASRWFRRATALEVSCGRSYEPERLLAKTSHWVAGLVAADHQLGEAAAKVARRLEGKVPSVDTPRLVHGTLYARHVIDMGTGLGLIDWDGFGRGPLAFDAGTFLSTVRRICLSHPSACNAVERAERAFLAGTNGVLDQDRLAWYRAVALLSVAHRLEVRRRADWKTRAWALLQEARGLVAVAA